MSSEPIIPARTGSAPMLVSQLRKGPTLRSGILSWAPLLALGAWLLTTVALFEFGPFDYTLQNRAELHSFLLAVHAALVLGYGRGLRRPSKDGLIIGPVRLMSLSVGISLASTVAAIIFTGGGDLSHLALALENPEAAYLTSSTKGPGTFFSYVSIVTAPAWAISLSLGFGFWKQITVRAKFVLLFLLALVIGSAIGSSIRSALLQILIFSGAGFASAHIGRRFRLRLAGNTLAASLIVASLFGMASYTAFIATRRDPSRDSFVNPLTEQLSASDHLAFSVLPKNWHPTFTHVAFYLGHSYARLAEALAMPHNGIGFGLSNSAFLIRNVERLTGWNGLEDISYGMRLDRNTGAGTFGVFWSTCYTWIASDVTFPGTIVVIFFLGSFLAQSWREAIRGRNAWAVAAFACFAFIVYSLPTTNPLQDGAGITTFLGLPLLWWRSRRLVATTATRRSV